MTYFDYNATTPLADEVTGAIKDALSAWGNPSSNHTTSEKARFIIDCARKDVATCIGASPSSIIFTSGGSESNNWVINVAIESYQYSSSNKKLETYPKPHIVTSTVEHDSISVLLDDLHHKQRADVTKVPIDKTTGEIMPSDVAAAIQSNTCLVTIMMANNETGTIMPIKEIVNAVRKKQTDLSTNVWVHTDAAQTIGKVKVDVTELDVDFLTVVGHKFYGPRIGALYVKNLCKPELQFQPFILGGGQEGGWRAGTENTPMIAGLGKAAALVSDHLAEYSNAMKDTRDYLEARLVEVFGAGNISFNCVSANKLPNTCNVSIIGKGYEGYKVVRMAKKFFCSTGSACHSDTCAPSKILLEFHISPEVASNAIRISTGRNTTRQDVDTLVTDLREVIKGIDNGL